DGDRRLAFVRSGVRSGVPWLTASKLSSLITYIPLRDAEDALPSRVRTPKGEELDLHGDALRAELTSAHGASAALLRIDNALFDREVLRVARLQADRGAADVDVVHAGVGGRELRCVDAALGGGEVARGRSICLGSLTTGSGRIAAGHG